MELSESDLSRTDDQFTEKKSVSPIYLPENSERFSVETLRKAYESLNIATESLKRKKQRYDKKKKELEVRLTELIERERRVAEAERTMHHTDDLSSSSLSSDEFEERKRNEKATTTCIRLQEENERLRQEINNLHLQIELQNRSTTWDTTSEKESYRLKALELNKREKALLQKEQEIDEYHDEANRLRLDAEQKQREAERLLLTKKKYIDELEDNRKQLNSRELEINDLERIKTDAIEQRREQVRLLEEELAKHSETLEKQTKELDMRERAFAEHQEEVERAMVERENKVSDYQKEVESALANLRETQELYSKMDTFVKTKRNEILEKETVLTRQQQELDLVKKQQNENEMKFKQEHSRYLDIQNQIETLNKKVIDYEKRINELQSLLAESRNENLKLSQEYMRYKDIGDTADKRVSLFSKTNDELQQKIESQSIFILQLQKRIAELQESNYFIANDHSRATLALNEVNGQVSRLLAAVNAKSPHKSLSVVQKSELNTTEGNAMKKDDDDDDNDDDEAKRVLFPSEPTKDEKEMIQNENQEVGIDPNFAIRNQEDQSQQSLDV